MKLGCLLLFLLLGYTSTAQFLVPGMSSETQREIDSLLSANKLQKVNYPNMSFCGGALEGYYFEGKLVYISSTYSGDSGYRTLEAYFENNRIEQIELEEHFPDWNSNAASPPIINSFRKYILTGRTYVIVESRDKIQSLPDDETLVDQLVKCVDSMRNELHQTRSKAQKENTKNH